MFDLVGAVSRFDGFAERPANRSPLRSRITAACRAAEQRMVPALLDQARLPGAQAAQVHALAERIARELRNRKAATGRPGLVQGLLQEYALSSQEGVALMCLAEALLRIPDAATRDALIRDKIAAGQWQSHAGRNRSAFVNAATWGLLITGKIVATHSEVGLSTLLTRLIAKGGEPLIRKGVDMAMRLMGEQFVTGETIQQALKHAEELEAQGFRYSYDMLGEAALTAHDAERYRKSYEQAIHAIGKGSAGRGVYEGPGLSIKLSALHPRYSRSQYQRVMSELYPVLKELTVLARHYDIGINIDAEEADRLELSLDMLERLCFEPALAGWAGIGFVIQAYQKRCPFVIDHVIDLARRSGHRLMVRLVKGAYWDSEIKRAQIDGQQGYPVYTRKAYTDVSYLACARKLLGAPEAIYPQFATHNAHSLAAIYVMADLPTWQPGQYEFQCLHGMGEPLYEQVVGPVDAGKLGRPCRIYAPVGTHETLLAYLVRRLLENGANTSFVNRIADPTLSLQNLIEDPVSTVERMALVDGEVGKPHPSIPLPADLYGSARKNSRGLDLSDEDELNALGAALAESARTDWRAAPMLASGQPSAASLPSWKHVFNPADHRDVVGTTQDAKAEDVDRALCIVEAFAPVWSQAPPSHRAALLERAADALQAQLPRLIGLLSREAGKSVPNGIAEVREAVDFLRYYGAQVRRDFDNRTHRPLGPVVCISPWNFPLAIFVGQVAAALAAGNPVLAKPAEQTPLIAAEAVRVLWEAGVPRAAVQLLPGRGEIVGTALVSDARTRGVMFTGSTAVARIIQKALSTRLGAGGRPVPLIAETGGQNAMIVDSSALVEQVVTDVMASAFDSAGQRCSALRVLCVQEEAADRLVEMIKGAMQEACVGNPARLAVDVGPVIDADARAAIEQHVAGMRAKGRAIHRKGRELEGAIRHGTYVMPTLIEIDSLSELEREVFGPVLHVLRYRRRDLRDVLGQINATGYGLTLGVHTRIDETIAKVVAAASAGNIYVNRNIVGAVVGVQPFGGEGLSGTGPKAGGPLYMYRLLAERPDDVLARALEEGDPEHSSAAPSRTDPDALLALAKWAERSRNPGLESMCRRFGGLSRSGQARALIGPTGERNVYSLRPRHNVLCLASSDADRLAQLAAVLAVGSIAVWPAASEAKALLGSLPPVVQDAIVLAQDWSAPAASFGAVLYHGEVDALQTVLRRLAERDGPIVQVRALRPDSTDIPLEALVIERSLSVNTAAAGGNASLMALG